MPRDSLQLESFAFRPADEVFSTSPGSGGSKSAAQSGPGAPAKAIRPMRVGFIGLDPTGQAMVSRLRESGHQLTLYDPAGEVPEELRSAGGSVANSIQDACSSADAVFTMLPDDEITESIILGPGGVVESLPCGAIHIGSSTISVECSDRIAEAHWDAGKKYVAAPVFARAESPADELFVIAAGCEVMIALIEPLLSPIGQLTLLAGWPSDALLVQLSANCADVSLCQLLARHRESGAPQPRSQLARLASPLARLLDIKPKGVLQ